MHTPLSVRVRRRCAVVAALLAVSLQAGLAFSREIVFAVSSGPVSLPVYVAEAKGFFKAEGVEVKKRDCASGRQCIEILTSGQADIATAAELLVTLDSFARSELVILATLSRSHQIRIVARKSAVTGEPGSWVGKRIGTVMGTSAEYYLDSWLLFQGVDRSRLTIVSLPADQLTRALQRHELDAIVIWEPLATVGAEALGADNLVLPMPRIYTQHFALVAARKTIAENPSDLQKVLRALTRASLLIAEEPATARLILQTRLGLGEAQASTYMREHDYALGLDQSLVSTMESQARWVVRGGHAPADSKPINLLRAIEPALLRTVSPDAVALVR